LSLIPDPCKLITDPCFSPCLSVVKCLLALSMNSISSLPSAIFFLYLHYVLEDPLGLYSHPPSGTGSSSKAWTLDWRRANHIPGDRHRPLGSGLGQEPGCWSYQEDKGPALPGEHPHRGATGWGLCPLRWTPPLNPWSAHRPIGIRFLDSFYQIAYKKVA